MLQKQIYKKINLVKKIFVLLISLKQSLHKKWRNPLWKTSFFVQWVIEGQFYTYRAWKRCLYLDNVTMFSRGGSRTIATSKVELFVIIVNGFQSSTIITKSSTLNVAEVLDPPLLRPRRHDLHFLPIILVNTGVLFDDKFYIFKICDAKLNGNQVPWQ